jgi:hypothetical protein
MTTTEAKATLLRALEQLEAAENDLGAEADRCDLVVIYSMGRSNEEDDWEEVAGWAATAGPKWMHAAMLRRAADAQQDAVEARDDEPEDED